MIVSKKLNILILGLLILLIDQQTFAQNVDFDRSNFKRKKTELRLAKENIKEGDVFLEEAIEEALLLNDV